MDWTCCSMSQTEIWGVWSPGRCLVLFAMFLRPFLSSFSRRAGHWGRLLPSGSAVAMRGCTWSTVSGWCVFKWHPHECQGPRFSSRTLDCNVDCTNHAHSLCEITHKFLQSHSEAQCQWLWLSLSWQCLTPPKHLTNPKTRLGTFLFLL